MRTFGSGASQAIAFAYHDISGSGIPASGFEGRDAARYTLDAERFEAHLRAVTEAEARQIRVLSEAAPRLMRQARPRLTFDDGGKSALHIADALERRGLTGYFFVIMDRIGGRRFMDKAEIRELRQRGHVVGAHSRSHPRLMSRLPGDVLLAEWRDSRSCLSDLLGESVTVGSVPGSYYAPRVGAAASEAGLEMLFTLEPTTRVTQVGRCGIYGRYAVMRETPAEEIRQLMAGRAAPRLRRQLLWTLRGLAKRVGGAAYIDLRRMFLERFGAADERG